MARTKKRDMQYLHIEKKKNGYVGVRIRIRKNGQSFSSSLDVSDYGTLDRTLEEARKIRNKTIVEMDEHRIIIHTPTVNELFLKSFELIPLSVKTQYKHKVIYKNSMALFSDMPIDQIRLADVQTCVNNYAKDHSENEVSRCITIWRRIYKSAFMEGYPVANLADAVQKPKCKPAKESKKIDITLETLNQFIDAVEHYNTQTPVGRYNSTLVSYLIKVLALTGMRPAEALALKRDDFHLQRTGNYISITKACGSNETTKQQIIHTKTKKSVRNIPISDNLLPIVKSLLNWTDHDFVFSDYQGYLIEIDDLCTYILNVSKKSNIPFNLYCLRHKFSTDLFKEGNDPAVIRDLMGHETTTMSLYYAYSSEKDRMDAVNNRKMA